VSATDERSRALSGTEPSDAAVLVGQITALLFVAGGPLDIGSLSRVLDVPASKVDGALRSLQAEPPAGLMLQRSGREVQLVTAPEASAAVRRLRGEAERQRLSRAALEVLSVVAYYQPTTRADIDSVRGVNSDHALETLVARGLVAPLGRRESVGRPILYGTTLEFLRLAGLRSLDELPQVEPGQAAPSAR
jgi:segregation and condensation protein B